MAYFSLKYGIISPLQKTNLNKFTNLSSHKIDISHHTNQFPTSFYLEQITAAGPEIFKFYKFTNETLQYLILKE